RPWAPTTNPRRFRDPASQRDASSKTALLAMSNARAEIGLCSRMSASSRLKKISADEDATKRPTNAKVIECNRRDRLKMDCPRRPNETAPANVERRSIPLRLLAMDRGVFAWLRRPHLWPRKRTVRKTRRRALVTDLVVAGSKVIVCPRLTRDGF